MKNPSSIDTLNQDWEVPSVAKKKRKTIRRSIDRSIGRSITRTQISNLKFENQNDRAKTCTTTIGRPSDDHPNTVRRPPDMKKNCEKRSVSQTIDLVMRINSVQKSSKSELSSRGKRPFKVFVFLNFLLPQAEPWFFQNLRINQKITKNWPNITFLQFSKLPEISSNHPTIILKLQFHYRLHREAVQFALFL